MEWRSHDFLTVQRVTTNWKEVMHFLFRKEKRLTKLTENPGQLPCHAVWSYQKFEILIGEKGSLQALFEVKLPKLFKFIIFYNLPAEKLQSRLSIL